MRIRNHYFIFCAVLITIIVAGGSFAFAAERRPLSPGEYKKQQERILQTAIKNRQKRKLPVDLQRTRLADALYARNYTLRRSYEAQSCYHMTDTKDPETFVYCDAARCTFENGQYCEQKSRNCYDDDGTLIINAKGLSQTDYPKYWRIKWNMCFDKDGSLITPHTNRSRMKK